MKNKWEAVRLCKPFNDSPYILTKGRQGCAFRIKMGHLFHEKGLAKASPFFNIIIDTQTSVLLTWRKIFSFCSIIFHCDIYWTLHLYYRQTAMFRGIIAMPFTAKMQHWSAGNGNIGRTAEETQRRGIHRL